MGVTKISRRKFLGEILFGGLVAVAVVALPITLLKYGGHYGHRHYGRVINIVGYNPEGENTDVYWSVHDGNKWHYGRKEGSTIRVKQGEAITLHVTSFDNVHGFALPEYGINTRIYPGRITTIDFKADKAGEFIYFCSIYCGDSDHGMMRGKLIVEADP